jgi:hypothetical protein
MASNCKPIDARAYTVPRSVEQQFLRNKEIVRLVDIGVLEEDFHLTGIQFFHHLQSLRKTEQ